MQFAGVERDRMRPHAESIVKPTHGFTKFVKSDIEQSIGGRFQQIVHQDPSRVAVKTDNDAISYATLNKMGNRVAHALRAVSGTKSEPIAVLGGIDVPTIATILGVFKAGKIYVPLENTFSEAWAQFILKDTKTRFVLAGKRWWTLAQQWLTTGQMLLDLECFGAGSRETEFEDAVPPDSLSQILYTSGTTGQPKGVMDTHRNMLHYVMRLTNISHVSPDDRMTLLRPPCTEGALSNLCLALLTGATILPLDLRRVGISAIADWLRRERITILHANPTIFRDLARQLTGAEEFPDLRLVRLGSGQVFAKDVELFKRHFPGALLLHVLSSTETNTYRAHFLTKDSPIPDGALPVGYSVEDMEVSILDNEGKSVEVNQIGEIAVRSSYMSPGYWSGSASANLDPLGIQEPDGRRTFKTGDLGRLHSDGCLEYLGRKDFRLKIRGHRVQAEEVESALLRVTGISHAVVIACKEMDGDQRLVAYITTVGSVSPTVSEIRRSLARWIPEYMIPGKFVFLDRLPLTSSGKVDRHALKMPGFDRPNLETRFAAPETSIQQVLVKIWCEALGVAEIGIHDLFLDLGGDSIIAARIVSATARIFPWELTLSELYGAETIAQTAQLLMNKAPSAERAERVAMLFLKVGSMSADEVDVMLSEVRNKGVKSVACREDHDIEPKR
jgi:acyl-CoA synthetase (AMP-forming)/AMP-acid ligase II